MSRLFWLQNRQRARAAKIASSAAYLLKIKSGVGIARFAEYSLQTELQALWSE